eukprot:COSAG02_NODE_240_length_27672_cov_67.291445_30_plen_74_part_00
MMMQRTHGSRSNEVKQRLQWNCHPGCQKHHQGLWSWHVESRLRMQRDGWTLSACIRQRSQDGRAGTYLAGLRV